MTVVMQGTVTGNVASVTLLSGCYAIPGDAKAILRLTLGSTTYTAAAAIMRVGEAIGSEVSDPDNLVPNLDQMIAYATRVEQAVAAASAATDFAMGAGEFATQAGNRADSSAEAADAAKGRADEAAQTANDAAQYATETADVAAADAESRAAAAVGRADAAAENANAAADYARNAVEIAYDENAILRMQGQITDFEGRTNDHLGAMQATVDGLDSPLIPNLVTLYGGAANWPDKRQTVAVDGATADPMKSIIWPSCAPGFEEAFMRCDIKPASAGDGTLTFTCDDVPQTDVQVYVAVGRVKV